MSLAHNARMHPLRAVTFGEPLSAARTPDFAVTEVRYAAGASYAPHSHDRGYLLLVLNGGFREEARGGADELSSGGVVAMPAGCAHRDRISAAGARGLLVTLERAFEPIARWRCFHGGAVSRAMVALYASFRDGDALAVEEILHDVTATPEAVRDGRCVRVALEVLHGAVPLRFADVAREAGVAPAYLARAFKRCTGQTMGAYLRVLRARRAAALLASTREALADVALAAGFADQSHLCRVFRGVYGVTPARYRRLMLFGLR